MQAFFSLFFKISLCASFPHINYWFERENDASLQYEERILLLAV
jgi:hypothetical protein